MKKIVFILCIISYYFGGAQTNIVHYQQFQNENTGQPEVLSEYLFASEQQPTYYVRVSHKINPNNIEEVVESLNNKEYGYNLVKYNNQQKTMLSVYPGMPKKNFAKESIPSIQWKLQKEHKTILGYPSQKAIGVFRGREYTVWFTKDIPISQGPWKLNGLPGLILEAKEDSNQFRYQAVKIILNSPVPIPKGLEDLFDTEEKTAVDIKEAIKKENELFEMLKRKYKSKEKKGTNGNDFPLRYSLPELSFEWEKTNKK